MSDEDVNELKQYISVMIREIGEMRKDFAVRFDKLEARVGGLEERMGGLEERMGGLEASMSEMKDETREMRKDIRALTIRFERFEARAADTRADVAELQDSVTVLEGGHVGDKLR